MQQIDYRFAKPAKFSYITPASQLNMYVKFKTGPSESSNLVFKTPEMSFPNGIELDRNGKYKMSGLVINDSKFVQFMNSLEQNIVNNSQWENCYFKSGINCIGSDCCELVGLKIPYRYSKFETKAKGSDGFLTLVNNLVDKEINARLIIELKNVWNLGNAYGPLWIVKQIDLV